MAYMTWHIVTANSTCSWEQRRLRLSTAVTEHHNQKPHGEERVYFIVQFVDHDPRKSGQELKARTWKSADTEALEGTGYWLAPPSLLYLLS